MKADFAQPFEQFNQFGQQMLSAMAQMNQIASSRSEQLLRLNNEMLNQGLEQTLSHMKTLGSFQSAEEALSAQSAYLNDSAKRMMDSARRYLELALDANAEISDVVQQNVQRLNDQARPKAPKAA